MNYSIDYRDGKLSNFNYNILENDLKYLQTLLQKDELLNKKEYDIVLYYRMPAQMTYSLLRILKDYQGYDEKFNNKLIYVYNNYIDVKITNKAGIRRYKLLFYRAKLNIRMKKLSIF